MTVSLANTNWPCEVVAFSGQRYYGMRLGALSLKRSHCICLSKKCRGRLSDAPGGLSHATLDSTPPPPLAFSQSLSLSPTRLGPTYYLLYFGSPGPTRSLTWNHQDRPAGSAQGTAASNPILQHPLTLNTNFHRTGSNFSISMPAISKQINHGTKRSGAGLQPRC